ncbi:nucleotidyltransferase domain-containing protein [Candidatus Woesearchaeota archaeon]|nr:nucleotidyltransferase domain-containing protein [Candidatus Woesearchaeota archaeon]
MKKADNILEIFFNYPTKQWHFEDIVRTAAISRPQATGWLKKFIKEKIIIRIKQKRRMPYYIANYQNAQYQIKKRLYALDNFEKSGFLEHLTTLPKANNIILFGSFSRWDWNDESDIDIFVYGSTEGFDMSYYRKRLGREIQLFICKDEEQLQKYNSALLRNIIEGYLIKGDLQFIEVKPHV